MGEIGAVAQVRESILAAAWARASAGLAASCHAPTDGTTQRPERLALNEGAGHHLQPPRNRASMMSDPSPAKNSDFVTA